MNKEKLGNIADVSIGALTPRYSKRYEGPKELREVLYFKGKKVYTEFEEIATDINDKYLSHEGEIILRLSEPQFAVIVDGKEFHEGMVISSKFAIIKPYDIVNPHFLVALLNSDVIKMQFNKYSEGSAIKQIKVKDLSKIELIIPTIEEQEEYLEAIQLINKEINLHEKLIAENKNLKEALIQKTQGVE